MTAKELDRIYKTIDDNFAILRDEATAYLRTHRAFVADHLAREGETLIPTSLGSFKLTVADLEGLPAPSA